MNKAFKTTSKVLANTFTILFGVITVGSSIALDNASAINGAFNIPVQKVVIDEDAEIKSYYDSDYFDVEEDCIEHFPQKFILNRIPGGRIELVLTKCVLQNKSLIRHRELT